MKVRKRSGIIYSVIKQCKQEQACYNEKQQNFRRKTINSQCRPSATSGIILYKSQDILIIIKGPSVCRQCCSLGTNKCHQKFKNQAVIDWRAIYKPPKHSNQPSPIVNLKFAQNSPRRANPIKRKSRRKPPTQIPPKMLKFASNKPTVGTNTKRRTLIIKRKPKKIWKKKFRRRNE